MRKALPLLVLLGLMAACSDEQALEQAKSRQQFQQALQVFEEAQIGYVPTKEAGNTSDPRQTIDLQEYRKNKLTQASRELQSLMDQGSESQRVSVRRLLADADISIAVHGAGQASASWAELSSESTKLMSLMVALDRAGARAKQFEADSTGPLLEKLREDLGQINRDLAGHEQAIGKLEPQIAEFKSKIAAFQAQNEQAIQQARSFYDKAFVSKGDAQIQLYRQSDSAQRNADTADREARRLTVSLDIASSELAIMAKQASLSRESAKATQEQIQDAEARQNQAREAREAALLQKRQAGDELEKALITVARAYAKLIEAKFTAAEEQMNHAVDLLTKAQSMTRGDEKKTVQTDLLSAHVMRANVLTNHALASAGYVHLLDILASQTEHLLPGRLIFREAAKTAHQTLDNLAGQSKQSIGDGVGLAAELAQSSAGDEAFVTLVNTKRDTLNRYSAQITAAQNGDSYQGE